MTRHNKQDDLNLQ